MDDRPWTALDVETTGVSVTDARVVSLGAVRYAAGHVSTTEFLVNPGCPIPPAATRVHGITDEMVATAPGFTAVIPQLESWILDTVVGFNCRAYDIPVLEHEYQRCGQVCPIHPDNVLDVMPLYHHYNRRTLADAYRRYVGAELDQAHTALADAHAVAQVLLAMQKTHQLPPTMRELLVLSRQPHPDYVDADGKIRWLDAQPVIQFGKCRDHVLNAATVAKHREYFEWVLTAGFAPGLKRVIREALDGTFPHRGAYATDGQ